MSTVGGIMSTVGVILSTMGGYHDAHGGYHEYRGGCSIPSGGGGGGGIFTIVTSYMYETHHLNNSKSIGIMWSFV